jgi:hypothetical protein
MVRINGVSSGWPSVIGPSTVASFERIPDKPFFPTSLTYCEQAERALDACATTVRSRHERRTPAQVALRAGHRTGTLAFRDGLRKGRDAAQGGRRGLLERRDDLAYDGAEPARARQWVAENATSGGKLTIGNANLELVSEEQAHVLQIVGIVA